MPVFLVVLLYVSPSVCLFIFRSTCLSVCLSLWLSVISLVDVCVSVFLSNHTFVSLSVSLYVCLSILSLYKYFEDWLFVVLHICIKFQYPPLVVWLLNLNIIKAKSFVKRFNSGIWKDWAFEENVMELVQDEVSLLIFYKQIDVLMALVVKAEILSTGHYFV